MTSMGSARISRGVAIRIWLTGLGAVGGKHAWGECGPRSPEEAPRENSKVQEWGLCDEQQWGRVGEWGTRTLGHLHA